MPGRDQVASVSACVREATWARRRGSHRPTPGQMGSFASRRRPRYLSALMPLWSPTPRLRETGPGLGVPVGTRSDRLAGGACPRPAGGSRMRSPSLQRTAARRRRLRRECRSFAPRRRRRESRGGRSPGRQSPHPTPPTRLQRRSPAPADDSGPSRAHSWLAASIPPGSRARSACNLRWFSSSKGLDRLQFPKRRGCRSTNTTAEPAGRGSRS